MIQAAQILFILSVLVVLHEFGHYITAKWFKVRVEKFYLFMDAGFSLFKKKIGETEWGIGWLPLGGYVKLSGMIDESLDKEQMTQPVQSWEFRAKPAWQRLIIMLGGIIVNLILAWFIYTIFFVTDGKEYALTEKMQQNGLVFTPVGHEVGFKDGDKIVSVDGKLQPNFNRLVIDILLAKEVKVNRNGEETTLVMTDEKRKAILSNEGKNFISTKFPTVVDSILPNSKASEAGLQKGDQIVGINEITTDNFLSFSAEIAKIKNDSLTLKVLRNQQEVMISAKTNEEGKLGFVNKMPDLTPYLTYEKYGFGGAVTAAVKESYEQFVYNVKSLKLVISPKTGAYTQIKSPIGIARQLPDQWNWKYVWNMTAILSVVLAVMNLLPIPGLDGGHALFTIIEMITGKTLNDKWMGYVQTAGMVFLLTLMAFVFGKDIYQLVMDKFF